MKEASGKFVIRMSGALHARLKEEARRKGKSLNLLCVAKLQEQESSIAPDSTLTLLPGMISHDFLDKVVWQWRGDLVGVVLFGSAAREEATRESDIDLLMALTSEARIERGLYRHWEEFCQQYAGDQDVGKISPHFVRLLGSVREVGGLWYEAAIDGIPLWERDRQVTLFLRSVRQAMGEGKIRRRLLHGSPYWVKEF